MNTIVVSSGMFDDIAPIKAAFKAADILRHDYSATVFVEIVSSFNAFGIYNETPIIKVGQSELIVNDTEDFDQLVNKVVNLVLQNIGNDSLNNSKEGTEFCVRKEPEAYAGVLID